MSISIGERFFDGENNETWIVVGYVSQHDKLLVTSEENILYKVITSSGIEKMKPVPYDSIEKGDFVRASNGKIFLVMSQELMRIHGVDYPLDPLVKVIRRFKKGFRIPVGGNYYDILDISDKGAEYLELTLDDPNLTHFPLNENIYPF